MKILVISNLFPRNNHPYNGIFVYNQLKALADLGHKIHVLAPTPLAPKILSIFKRWKPYTTCKIHPNIDLKATQIPYFRPPGAWFRRYEGLSCYYFVRNTAAKLHDVEKYDLILSNCIVPDGYAAVLLGKTLNLPVVCSPVGHDIMILPKKYKFTLKPILYCLLNADLVYANSRILALETERLTKNKIRVETIYRGCNLELFSKSKYSKEGIRKHYGIKDEDLVFTFMGTIQKEKGLEELTEAFFSIVRKNKHVKLSLIGGGPFMTQMKEHFSHKGISERVLWHGVVEHNKTPELLAIADFFVFPSYSEGMPNALIEAMAMDLPVIATNVGGIPELVQNEITGLLINPRSVEELETAMERFIKNKDWAKKLAEMGSLKVRKIMDCSIISEQLQRLLESVLSHRTSTTRIEQ